MVVEEIGEIEINGNLTKVYNYVGEDYVVEFVYEGIGSGNSFFASPGRIVSDGCYGQFIAYSDNDKVFSPTGCLDYPDEFPERKFSPLGAEWLFEGWSEGDPSEGSCADGCLGNYNLYRVVDNKVFRNRNYAVIQRFHRTKTLGWQDKGIVAYFYDVDGEFFTILPMYDFQYNYSVNTQGGDEVYVNAPLNYPLLYGDDEYVYTHPYAMNHGGLVTVESVEEIEIDGQERKKVTYIDEGFRLGTVIEGIGPLREGLVGNDIPLPSNGCEPILRCYSDSIVTYSTTECGCSFPDLPNSVYNFKGASVEVFPNPAMDKVYFQSGENNAIESVEIFDRNGRFVERVDDVQGMIDVSFLGGGLYMIRIISRNGNEMKSVLINR